MAMKHQLNLMKVGYQSLKKENPSTREQMNKMKSQISTLLRRESQTEFEQQEQLSAMLEQRTVK